MSDDDVKALREAAKAATPGPWEQRREEYDSHDAMTEAFGKCAAHGGHVLHYLKADGARFPAFTGNGPTSKANAAYLAAANPSAILRLLTRLEAAEAVCEAVDLADPTTVVYPLVDAWRAAGGGK